MTRDKGWLWRKVKGRLISDLTYPWLLLSRRVQVGKRTYRLRRSARLNLVRAASQRGAYETAHDTLVQQLLRLKPGVFFDVGANVGQTLLKLLSIDPEREYVGAEPQISSALNIDLFIKDNSLRKHTILPVAVGEEYGMLKIGTRFADDTAASTSFDFRPADFFPLVQHVPVIPGDQLVNQLGVSDVGIIKVDVEGAEISVLRGFDATIAKFRPFVIFEALPKVLRATMERLDDGIITVREEANRQVTSFFKQKSYALYLMDDDGGLVACESVHAHDTEITNYLAAPVECELMGGEPGKA